MVHDQKQNEFRRIDLNQGRPKKRAGLQIERRSQLGFDNGVKIFFPALRGPQIDPAEHNGRSGHNDLLWRAAWRAGKTGAQSPVALDHHPNRLLKSFDIKRATQAQHCIHIVGNRIGSQALQLPKVILCGRQGQQSITGNKRDRLRTA